MPTRPASPCTHQPCPSLVPGGGACPTHGRARYRGSSTKQGYGSTWRNGPRAEVMATEHCCRMCGAHGQPDDHADHIVPRRQGGSDERANLQRLCGRCHRSKTADQDGGFGNRVKVTM